jgi:predicted nucleic acid-binding protein
VELIRVNDSVLNEAGVVQPPDLRSLDAIHLVTARQLGSDLSHIVTYDDRMAEGANRLGLRVLSPRPS